MKSENKEKEIEQLAEELMRYMEKLKDYEFHKDYYLFPSEIPEIHFLVKKSDLKKAIKKLLERSVNEE